MTRSRLVVVAALILAVAMFFALDLGRFLTFDYLSARHGDIADLHARHPGTTAVAYETVEDAGGALPTFNEVEISRIILVQPDIATFAISRSTPSRCATGR